MICIYPSYVKTKINWTPYVPEHWDVMRGKRFFFNKKELNKDNQCTNVLSLTLNGVINNDADRPIGLSPSDYATYQIFDENNLVFKLIDLENISTSRVGIVHERGIMSSAYIRLINRYDCNMRYFYYLYFDLYLRQVFNGLGAGVRSTLNSEDLLNMPIYVPPRDEQDQIVRYLDWKMSLVNKLITLKKKEIRLVMERQSAVISDLVFGRSTPGRRKTLNDLHGVEVPDGWRVFRNKFLFKERTEHTETGSEVLLSVSRHYGVKPYETLDTQEQYATIKPALSLVGYKKVYRNDLVMNIMRAQNGSFGISLYNGIVSPAYCVYMPIREFDRMYIHYLYRTPEMVNAFSAISYGIVEHRRRLYPENFLRMVTCLPPIEMQRSIVFEIERSIANFKENTKVLESQISMLQELKKRIIFDAVSGKIDLRNVRIPNYEFVSAMSDEDEDTDDQED